MVTIYDVGEHQRRVFMVMEIMRGGSIGDRLKSGRDVSHEEVLRWLREAAGALDTAHEAGVVHRDIKPGNLCSTTTTGSRSPTSASRASPGRTS